MTSMIMVMVISPAFNQIPKVCMEAQMWMQKAVDFITASKLGKKSTFIRIQNCTHTMFLKSDNGISIKAKLAAPSSAATFTES